MRAWRVCKLKWVASAFSGIGAADYPGRWNLSGVKAVYCADSRALGSLEVLAHVTRKHTLALTKFVAIPVDIPEELIGAPTRLPQGWDQKPNISVSQAFGSRFLRSRAAMRVPSAVVRGEYCYVLNPLHPEFRKLKIGRSEPLLFDTRVITGHQKP